MAQSKKDYLIVAALAAYKPRIKTLNDFQEDFSKLKNIKKSLNRLASGKKTNLRLLNNHFILLFNCFEHNAITKLLFEYNDEKVYDLLDTILYYNNFKKPEILNSSLLQELNNL